MAYVGSSSDVINFFQKFEMVRITSYDLSFIKGLSEYSFDMKSGN